MGCSSSSLKPSNTIKRKKNKLQARQNRAGVRLREPREAENEKVVKIDKIEERPVQDKMVLRKKKKAISTALNLPFRPPEEPENGVLDEKGAKQVLRKIIDFPDAGFEGRDWKREREANERNKAFIYESKGRSEAFIKIDEKSLLDISIELSPEKEFQESSGGHQGSQSRLGMPKNGFFGGKRKVDFLGKNQVKGRFNLSNVAVCASFEGGDESSVQSYDEISEFSKSGRRAKFC